MARAGKENIADGVSIKVMKAGGLTRPGRRLGWRGVRVDRLCGDMHETGLGHLAGVHLIAATPEITLGCEFYHASYYVKQDILAAPFPVSDGLVHVPDGPGLGFVPDLEMIEKMTRMHR